MTSSISNNMTGLDASPTFERTVSSPAFGENSHLRPKDQAERAWQRMNGESTKAARSGIVSEIREKASEAVDSIKEGAHFIKGKISEGVEFVEEKMHIHEQASPKMPSIHKEHSRQVIIQPTVSSHGIEQPVYEDVTIKRMHSRPVVIQPIVTGHGIEQSVYEQAPQSLIVDERPIHSALPAPVRFDVILAKPKASPPKRLAQKPFKKSKSIKTAESKAPQMRDSPLRRMRASKRAAALRINAPDNRPLRLKIQNAGVSKARVQAEIMREFKAFMRKEAPTFGKPQEGYTVLLTAPKRGKPVLSSKAPKVGALRPLSSKFLESRRRIPTLLRTKDVSQRLAMVKVQFKGGADKLHRKIVKDFKSFMVREENKITDQWADDREFQGEEYEAALQAFGVNDKHAPVIEGRIMTGRTLYTLPSMKAKESTIEGDFKLASENVETTHGTVVEEKPEMSNFIAEALSKAQ